MTSVLYIFPYLLVFATTKRSNRYFACFLRKDKGIPFASHEILLKGFLWLLAVVLCCPQRSLYYLEVLQKHTSHKHMMHLLPPH